MGLVVAALYFLFSCGICLTTALAALLLGIMIHGDTLGVTQTYCQRFAVLKYLPWRGIWPNCHLLKALPSSPFTVTELNMTCDCFILNKSIPWTMPTNITSCH